MEDWLGIGAVRAVMVEYSLGEFVRRKGHGHRCYKKIQGQLSFDPLEIKYPGEKTFLEE